ncbi:hypothetical protein [Nostoc sp.]
MKKAGILAKRYLRESIKGLFDRSYWIICTKAIALPIIYQKANYL